MKNNNFLSKTEAKKSHLSHFVCLLVYLLLIGIFFFGFYKPFRGELEALKHKKTNVTRDVKEAEKTILKALTYDPTNSAYCLYASQLYMGALRDNAKASDYVEKAIINFNGDLTLWSVHYQKGIIKYRVGSIFEATEAFKKALYYYPLFEPAQEKLKEIEEIIKKHDRVVIKLR